MLSGDTYHKLLVSEETKNFSKCGYKIGGHTHLAKSRANPALTHNVYAAGGIHGNLKILTNKSGTFHPGSYTYHLVNDVFNEELKRLQQPTLQERGTEIQFSDAWE